MSAGRPKDRPRMISSHESSSTKPLTMPSSSAVARPGSFSNSYHGESFAQQPYNVMQNKPIGMPYDLTQSADARLGQDMYEHGRRLAAPLPGQPYPQPPRQMDRLDVHQQRKRSQHGLPFTENMEVSPEKHNISLRPPVETAMIAPVPKKARLQNTPRFSGSGAPLNYPLRIDTALDTAKIKMEPPGGYHPETEAISPTLPTESHDSKSDIVHSINEVDREINQIENQIQQLQKKQFKLEAEAAKPKEDIPEDDSMESKPLSIAQIVYKENRKLAHQSHSSLSKMKYTSSSSSDLPIFHQPCDTQVYHENVRKFVTFKAVLQSYFKKKALERERNEKYWVDNYEHRITSWLKKVDAKTLKKNIKDMKTREYYEKTFPDIKKHREDKERITSRVGARGVSSGYARTEAEFEQIIDGITEQEEEDKKMKAYAIIPPMLNQTQRKLRFINRNGLIQEPMSEYKERKQTTSWSPEEKEIFKEKYLERPKQFGHIAELLPNKTLNDCVLYYYMSKKTENYKQLLKKHAKRPPRRPQMKTIMRNSNEGQMNTSDTASNAKGCDVEEQELVRVIRPAESDSKHNCCAGCGVKLESYSVSHNVTVNTCSQFGLDPQNFQAHWRVCATCAKLRRRKTKVCPIPSCTWPHKRARHLPLHWDQIHSHIKDKIMKELQMEEEVKRCCSACYDKIADLLLDGENDTDEPTNEGGFTSKWSTEDTNTFKKAICLHGKKWALVASMVVGKSEEQCRMYFYRNKKKLGLDAIYCDYRKQRTEQGLEPEPSDDSVDEDDDDNLEDNDMSSEDDASVAVKFPTSTVISSSNTSNNSPSVTAVKMEVSTECDGKSGHSERSDAVLSAAKESPEDNKPVMKMETKEQALQVKAEKMDHDSSATASADEEPSPDQNCLGVMGMGGTNPLSKAMLFIKREPGLMANPDGMLAFPSSAPPFSTNTSVPSSQPPSSQSNAPSTSVKDLIDLAIEDALGSGSANDTGVGQRQSVINQCPPLASAPSDVSQKKNGYQQDMRMDVHSQRHSVGATQRAGMPEDHSVRRGPLLPYEGDPRAYVQVLQEKHSSSPHSFAGKMAVESGQVRAPPPAHSHHLNSSPLDKRNSDRKSPAATPFAIYDKSSNSDSRMNMSPHSRSTIGQPPPLISSGVPHHPSHLPHVKKESHAGGSILQGTSAGHSHQPPTRFEAGSISHGTPRNQPEVKPSPVNRGDEKMSRSPRPHSAMHSPAVPNHAQSYERHLEQQQQQLRMFHDALRRGAGLAFPPALFDPYQTKSVLQNDFQTAKQMSNSSVNPQAAASAYTSALEKEKGGKASPHPFDAARLGFPPYMMDQQAHALMMMGLMNPRMMTPEQRRFIPPPAPTTVSTTPPMSKEDIKSWSFVSKPQPLAARPELAGPPKPSITQGLIPKTVEMLQRPPDANRRSASPHIRKDSKTRYEKEVEEMRIKSQSERKKADSEGDNSQLSAAYPGNNRLSDFYGVPRSPSMGSQPDLGPGGYNSKSQGAHRNSMMAGSKGNDLPRELKKEKPSSDYRDRLASQYQRSASSTNRIEQSVQNSLAVREDRKMLLEHDQKLAMHYAQKMEAERRHEVEMLNSHRPTDMSRPVTSKPSADDTFASKKLAEVSKGLQKDVLLKDGSALFSSSFEKDQMPQNVTSTKYSGEEMKPGFTTANLIDAIITQQINRENMAENASKGPPSHQHTSVIVKQQRPIQHSRSDTDISSYSMHERVSSAGGSEPSSAAPSSSNNSVKPVTLADRINEIITNDYNKGPDPLESHPSVHGKLDRPASNSSSLQPYRVEDIEPISPPGTNSQPKNKTFKPLPVTNKKHAGIRSLLGADNSNSTESVSKSVESSAPTTTAGMSLMDVLKNNIEDAIRHDADFNMAAAAASAAANNQHRPGYTGQPPHYSKPDERSEGARGDMGVKKRGLEAMLAPESKRLALSPRQAKSPEEVEMYTSSATSTHASNSIYRPPPMASFSNSAYRSANTGHYQPSSHNVFNPPSSTSKPHMTNSSAKTATSVMGQPLSQNYHQERMANVNNSYSERPSSAGHTEDLTREDNFNPRHGANQPSPIRSSMRSPGIASSSNNIMSPVVGYHNSSNSRVSPIAAASPLAGGQTRRSPITGNSKMSPGVYGASQTGGSRPSSRQSPSLSNRHSPIASRQSPMDAAVKSPLTSTESPTSRVNHINSDLSRHGGGLNENHMPNTINPKLLEAARSLHSLGTLHAQPRPLLSERYETLSDDERS